MGAVYFFKGQGEYVLQNGEEQHEFGTEKHHGTLILLERDAHVHVKEHVLTMGMLFLRSAY